MILPVWIDKNSRKPLVDQITAHWTNQPVPGEGKNFDASKIPSCQRMDIGKVPQPIDVVIKFEGDKGCYAADPWIVYRYPKNQKWDKLKFYAKEVILRVEIYAINMNNKEVAEYLLENNGTSYKDIKISLIKEEGIVEQNLNQIPDNKYMKIIDIDKKLEKLYLPFLHTIRTFRDDFHTLYVEYSRIGIDKMRSDTCKNQDTLIIWEKIIEKYFYFRQDLEKIEPFLYLDADVEEMFYRSIEGIDILYVKDFNDWKNLEFMQKCQKINEIKDKIDFDNLNKRAILDIMIQNSLRVIESLKNERKINLS